MYITPSPCCPQLPLRRSVELSSKRLSKKNKTVHRVYGGHLSHSVVRERWGLGTWCLQEQEDNLESGLVVVTGGAWLYRSWRL